MIAPMLIGAHVSPAGGPAKARRSAARALGAEAIQIFNQNPRAWKPTVYSDEQIAAYHEALDGSPVKALLIHAVYLLNAATDDPEIAREDARRRSSLRCAPATRSAPTRSCCIPARPRPATSARRSRARAS